MASATCDVFDTPDEEILHYIYPQIKGKEHLYGWYPPGYNTLSVPSYKIPTTYDDELQFNSMVKENIYQSLVNKTHPEAVKVDQEEPAAITSDDFQPLSQETQTVSQSEPLEVVQPPPSIRSLSRASSDRNEKPRLGLQARLEAIRIDLMNRERQGPPLVRALSAQSKHHDFAFNRKSQGPKSSVTRPVFSAVPPGWINRIPEPDLRYSRSPKQSRPSSQQSTASLNRSVTLSTPPAPASDASLSENQQIPSQERPPSPVLTNQNSISPTSTNHVSLPVRPKTAPTSLMHRKSNIESYNTSKSPSKYQSAQRSSCKPLLSRSYCIEASGGLNLWLQGQRMTTTSQPKVSKENLVTRRPKTAYAKLDSPDKRNATLQEFNRDDHHTAGGVIDNNVPAETLSEQIDRTPNDEPFDEKLVVKDLLEDDYAKQLNKYGWRMEIPFDPLGLKGPLIPGRSSCSVKLVEPEILPQAPPMYKENKDTFFHNVMSSNKRTRFEISPDFMSERYNQAKDELRKRGLWKYSEKNFSFLY